jgi:hypothetical protein
VRVVGVVRVVRVVEIAATCASEVAMGRALEKVSFDTILIFPFSGLDLFAVVLSSDGLHIRKLF